MDGMERLPEDPVVGYLRMMVAVGRTRSLCKLVRQGLGDSAEADELREQILDSWDALSEEQKKRLNQLSGDLLGD